MVEGASVPSNFFSVIRCLPAYAEFFSNGLLTFLSSAKPNNARQFQCLRITWKTSYPNCGIRGLRKSLANPSGQRPTNGIAQRSYRCRNAGIMSELVLNSRLLLCLSVLRGSDRKTHWQMEAFSCSRRQPFKAFLVE